MRVMAGVSTLSNLASALAVRTEEARIVAELKAGSEAVAASARPTEIFAIDDAAANDVMVFRMVRRSGLLYRIVSSLAAIRFDCLSEVVWLAANAARD